MDVIIIAYRSENGRKNVFFHACVHVEVQEEVLGLDCKTC